MGACFAALDPAPAGNWPELNKPPAASSCRDASHRIRPNLGRMRPGVGQIWAIPTDSGPSLNRNDIHPASPTQAPSAVIKLHFTGADAHLTTTLFLRLPALIGYLQPSEPACPCFAEFGCFRQNLAQRGQNWPSVGQLWKITSEFGPILTNLDPIWRACGPMAQF